MIAAGLVVTGTTATAWTADGSRRPTATRALSLPPGPPGGLDLEQCERACRAALDEAASAAPQDDWLGVTVSAPPAIVLLDARGDVLGAAVLGGARRGASYAGRLADTYGVTGQPPRPELALAALLAVQAEEPDRWAATSRVLLLHDWLVLRMTGVLATEVSGVCGAGMADVARRSWAADLLQDNGIHPSQLAAVVEPGTVVGELRAGWGLPPALPVVAGCARAQLVAMGAGGLADGVVSVVLDPDGSVQAAVSEPVLDPLGRVALTTHAGQGSWALETAREDPVQLRAAVDDVERVLGRPATAVVLGGPQDEGLARSVAEALGREVRPSGEPHDLAAAGAVLVARAVGAHAHVPHLPVRVVGPAAGPP